MEVRAVALLLYFCPGGWSMGLNESARRHNSFWLL